MPFLKENELKHIQERLAVIQAYVVLANKVQLYDIDLLMEDFCTGFLNVTYGWSLKNINHEKKNTPAIDLVDDDRKICVQVTSDKNGEKVKKTVSKFIENGLEKKYSRLVIFILVPRQKTYSVDEEIEPEFSFFWKRDVWGIDTIYKYISSLDLKKIQEIKRFIDSEFPEQLELKKNQLNDRWWLLLEEIRNENDYNIELEARVLLPDDLLSKYKEILRLRGELSGHCKYRDYFEDFIYSAVDDEEKEKIEELERNAEIYDDMEPYIAYLDEYLVKINEPYQEPELIHYRKEIKLIKMLTMKVRTLRSELIDGIVKNLREKNI